MRGREEQEREDLDFENVFLKVRRIIFLHSRERLHSVASSVFFPFVTVIQAVLLPR